MAAHCTFRPFFLPPSFFPDLRRSLIEIRSRWYRDTPYVGTIYRTDGGRMYPRARTLHSGFERWSRVPTYSRRDTYESSRFAIYAITAARRRPHQDGECFTRSRNGRFALMHERCHAPFRARSAPSKEFSADAVDTSMTFRRDAAVDTVPRLCPGKKGVIVVLSLSPFASLV